MEPAEKQIKILEKENYLSRDEMITEYLPHVKRIVNRIVSHLPPNVVETDDLFDAGIIGLIEAAERYDHARDNKFITYATFRIKGAVLSELRSRDFHSRSTRKKLREFEKAFLRLEQKFGGAVNDEEVAKELGLNLDEYYQIKRLASTSFISFEELGYASNEERNDIMNYLVNGDRNDAFMFARLKETETVIARVIEQLPEKEKLVVSLYYWDELTMKEIGKVLDITESRVSQIHSNAVIRIRRRLKKEKLLED